MKTFIEQCARELVSRHEDTSNYVLVIPSKRAKKYVLEELARTYNKPIFLPIIYTIEEFTARWINQPIIDKTRQLFLLFKVIKSTEKFQDLSFEEFLNWGPMLTDDFEDINRYLLNANHVFSNLLAIKELESWNLDESQELSESQRKFMEFWDELPAIHQAFNKALSSQNKSTSGQALRHLAEYAVDLISDDKHYYFIGFNALSLGELTVINALKQRKQATYWVDADEYYVNNPRHEAGTFIRKNLAFLGLNETPFIQNSLVDKPLNINVVACSQITGQVKLAATELAKKSVESLNQTLVLLADETLIVPLMKNIPSSVNRANITIGLPLKQTSIKSLIDVLFSIQENYIRFNTKAAYYKDLMGLFQHPLIAVWLDKPTINQINEWERKTIQQNKVFQHTARVSFSPLLDELTSIAFTAWDGNYQMGITLMQQLISILEQQMQQGVELEHQQLIVFQEALVTLSVLAAEGLPTMNIKTFRTFFNQHWNKKAIAFHGNPTQGLQIMGLLESRMLDFKQLIVLGMNEGMLPSTNPIDSIIPMDLRRGLGLPTAREKQGLFAHHFYRLLHTAEEVMITYGISNDSLGTSEPSRYIAQLEMELARVNENCSIQHHFYSTSFPENNEFDSAVVVKRPQIHLLLENYFSKNISASAIGKYLSCPLDFYYRYLAEFGEEDSVEEELESSSMGRFIHNTLEKLFTPFVEVDKQGNLVTPPPPAISTQDVENMLLVAPALLKEEFLAFLNNDNNLIETGKNWLTYNVAKELTLNLLKNDITYINRQAEPVYIHRVEAKLTAPMTVMIADVEKQVQWIGFVDRIDRVGDSFRLVDYKSGKVKIEDVTYKRKDTVVESFKGCKHALQLAVYTYLFKSAYNQHPASMGIYAIQRKTDAFFPLDINGLTHEEFLSDFQQLMNEVISQIFDETIPFTHASTAKYCGYC
ncbi:MAG: PD-(D/E)XK nuclease family protein [Flavobacteriales bacterium]